jgi:hypothetical protein
MGKKNIMMMMMIHFDSISISVFNFSILLFQENQRARTVQRKRNLIPQKLNQLKHHPKEVIIND